MNVLEQLKQGRDFTATEEALASYLLSHPDEAAELTIGELANRMHCSNSSIVRLCRKLGLDGFREFRVELARQLERGRVQRDDIDPNRPFGSEDGIAEMASALATLARQAIDDTYAYVSLPMVRRAAKLLMEARHVVYYAVGDTYTTMEGFASYLLKCGIVCTHGLVRGDYAVAASSLGPSDVVLIISYSGTLTNEYQQTFDVLRSRRCKIIAISADPTLRERVFGYDCAIMLPAGETLDHVATFYSQECIRYVLNLIYAEIYAANYHENLTRWQTMERTYQQVNTRMGSAGA